MKTIQIEPGLWLFEYDNIFEELNMLVMILETERRTKQWDRFICKRI